MLPREMLERSVIHMSLKGLGLWVPEPGEKTVIGAFLSALTSALSFIRQETETCSRAEKEPELRTRNEQANNSGQLQAGEENTRYRWQEDGAPAGPREGSALMLLEDPAQLTAGARELWPHRNS